MNIMYKIYRREEVLLRAPLMDRYIPRPCALYEKGGGVMDSRNPATRQPCAPSFVYLLPVLRGASDMSILKIFRFNILSSSEP